MATSMNTKGRGTLTFRQMAASEGFRSGWWVPYGYVMCPTMFQRADDADYWTVHESLDCATSKRARWMSATGVRKATGIESKRVSRALRLLVRDGVVDQHGRKYRLS